MKEYYLTFGTRYTFKEHPTLGYYPDLPDGYITIEAPDYYKARDLAFDRFGSAWAFLYEELPDMSFFTKGELFRVKYD